MEHGAGNATLLQQLGEPLRTGPWYNASVGVTHGGLIGNCTLSMVGSRHSADVAIRVGAHIRVSQLVITAYRPIRRNKRYTKHAPIPKFSWNSIKLMRTIICQHDWKNCKRIGKKCKREILL